ncbi:MAG: protoheme IX farnesyltransferase, partial [Alphaproteobacteria bacterium]|nr:protoheme IX farnesyltransferase [Alphaproteobacteria bacterium]
MVLVSEAEFRDYFFLLKPRVMTLVVFTGAVGYLVAPTMLHPLLGIIAIFALALGAGASGAMNMVYERERDALMERTRERPLPTGLMHPSDAMAFAVILAVVSLILMWLSAGVLAAALLAFSIFFYVVIYTIWLKPSTPQNIVIGGAAGAFPPMIGWVVATGAPSWDGAVLFAVIFFWTPPHFWALAIHRKDDYAKVNIPMLPVTHGVSFTKTQILFYTVLLFIVGLLPYLVGMSNWLYLIGA